MKRKFLFLISTFITISSPIGFCQFVSAIDNPDPEYWTLEEMAELSDQSFKEAQELCQEEGRGCLEQYLMERRSRGGKYEALDSFDYGKLIITAVNPTKGTIKLIYRTEDKSFRYSGKEDEPATLKSVYIGRISGEPDVNYSPWNDILNTVNDREVMRKIHMVFTWDLANPNHIDFLPNVEQEFNVEDLTLSPDIHNNFYFIIEDSISRYLDVYRLSDCLADYKEGTECSIRYSKNGPIYVPVSTANDDIGLQTTEDQTKDIQSSENTVDGLSPREQAEPNSDGEKKIIVSDNSSSVPTTPNTGLVTELGALAVLPQGITAILAVIFAILHKIFKKIKLFIKKC